MLLSGLMQDKPYYMSDELKKFMDSAASNKELDD